MQTGSIWRKWDLHVHTPDTSMANEFSSWEEYLKAFANEKEVCVVGVTDYLSIEGYKRLLQESQKCSFGSIKLLVPNIEFRVTPRTDKGHAINLHLIIDPSATDHIAQIESSLSRLSINYNGQVYSCIPSEIVRLGGAFEPSANTDKKKLEIGTIQYKIDFSDFVKWLRSETWLKANSLVAVSGGNDGPSGIKDSGWVASQEEIWRAAHIVFTSNENNRNFWLGKDPSKKDGAIKMGAPKPCVNGSDAHSMATLFQPRSQFSTNQTRGSTSGNFRPASMTIRELLQA